MLLVVIDDDKRLKTVQFLLIDFDLVVVVVETISMRLIPFSREWISIRMLLNVQMIRISLGKRSMADANIQTTAYTAVKAAKAWIPSHDPIA